MKWSWCWVAVLVVLPLPRCKALPREDAPEEHREVDRHDHGEGHDANDVHHQDIRRLEKNVEELWDAVHYLEEEVNHHLHREHDEDWHDLVLEETRRLQHEERVHRFEEDHPRHAEHHDDEMFQHLNTVHRGHSHHDDDDHDDDDDDDREEEEEDSDEQRDDHADSHEDLFDAHDQHHVHHPHFDRIHGDLLTHDLASRRMKYPGVLARSDHKHDHEHGHGHGRTHLHPHSHGHGHSHTHSHGGKEHKHGQGRGGRGRQPELTSSPGSSRGSLAGRARGRAGGRPRPGDDDHHHNHRDDHYDSHHDHHHEHEDDDTWHDHHHQHLYHDDYHPENLLEDTTLLKAYCTMKPNVELPESRVTGIVIITQRITPEGEDKAPVFFDMHLEGFNVSDHGSHQPEGHMHGFHLHDQPVRDKCSEAKGHYNPEGVTHSAPFETDKHVGDLGNIACDHKGVLEGYVISYNHLSLEGPESIIGRSIVIHEGRDDLGQGGDQGSLTTGNAGGRLACCTIGTKPPAVLYDPRLRFKG